jgi:hypothetical protein
LRHLTNPISSELIKDVAMGSSIARLTQLLKSAMMEIVAMEMDDLLLESSRTDGYEPPTLTSMLLNESSTEAMEIITLLPKNSETMATQLMEMVEVPLVRLSQGTNALEQLGRLLLDL